MKKEELKIIFMGTSFFARKILASLLEENYKISAVFTQPDKKSGRSQKLETSPVKELAELRKIPCFQPFKFTEETVLKIKEIDPDLIVVAAYGKIIPREVLEIPKHKAINVHPSLLPKFRGPSPIQNAILQGEKEIGITIMLMDDKVDHGDILNQTKTKIDPKDTTESLTKKIIEPCSELLSKTIESWVNKKIKPQKQDDTKATYCQLIEREDGHIFWNEEAQEIYNKYRAFQPWPGIFCIWENKNNLRIKIIRAGVMSESSARQNQIGEVIEFEEKIGVQTAKGKIILEEIQVEGKKPVKIKEFINGYPDFIGSILR